MCGIAGQVALGPDPPDREAVKRMCDLLIHRGPDSFGVYDDDCAALGVRRLAIIDVEAGDQPIFNEDRSVAVVLNGEIYNFQALRERLEARGHRFATASDTEVIAHLYEDLGDRLVHELRGMFAFALWDSRRRRLLMARDRVGKKPLYYWHSGDSLTFASELSALLEDRRIKRRVDAQAVDMYLALLYVPHPFSAIEGVQKLPPATTLVWDHRGATAARYWRLEFAPKDRTPPDEVGPRIREHLREAVQLRLISERPLGAFLSGGVDSAAVVATMAEVSARPVKTFSIGFKTDRFNELPYARRIAEIFATDHTEHIVDADAISVLPKLITHYGDPFGDSSAIPSYYVARAAREDVVVALNGDGGDESFAGYNRYISNAAVERLQLLPAALRRSIAKIAVHSPEPRELLSNFARARRLALSLPLAGPERYAMRMTYFADSLRRDLYTRDFADAVESTSVGTFIGEAWRESNAVSPVDRMLDVDVATYLPGDLLVKMDIATMANSLEARSPFLDHVLMEMVARLPVSQKVRGTRTKVALKTSMRGVVPDELLDRPKWGFSVPLNEWLRGPLRQVVTDVLSERRTAERGYFRPDRLRILLKENAERRVDRSTELWLVFVLELWCRRFLDGESEAALL